MNATQLLAQFDRLAEAPNAVPRLRRFILDLAVRGKLVEQDEADEPAAELLKRIQATKAKRIKSGELRSPRDLDFSADEEEMLFKLPFAWHWVRLADMGAIIGGGTPPSGDFANFTDGGKGIAWLTPADLGKRKDLFVSHGARDLTEAGMKAGSATLMPAGSVLFTSRAPIGYTAIAANNISTNQGFKSVVPYLLECSKYIATYLQAFAPWVNSKATGTTFKEVSGKIVSGLPFPLPPLAEQHRIVAKVDELMALCDQLEAAQQERERRRDRLATASLQSLNQPAADTTPEAQREHARFHLHHLPRLTTRSEHIKAMRQTFLNLAVQGRFVNQKADDEPGVVLLERLNKARAALVVAKQLRPSKEALPVEAVELPSNLPAGWVRTRLGQVYDVRDGTHDTPKYVDVGYPLVTSKNLSSGCLTFHDVKLISEADHRQISERSAVAKNDVLLAMIGSIGNPVIVDTDRPFSIKNVALFKYFDMGLSSPRFLCLYLQHATDLMRKLATGGLQPFVSLGFLRNFPLALPPLAEQHRIVAKVDELMALCDQLEAQLTATQTDSGRLLDAVLEAALAPA